MLANVWMYADPLAPAGDALDAAIETAARSGARLTLLAAIGRGEDRIFQTSFGEEILRIVAADREARLRDLEATARRTLPADRVTTALLEGDVPWHAVVAHAVARAPDLLVTAARAADGFDSPTHHFFRKCPVPVWAVTPGRPVFPLRVLAAVDPGVEATDPRRLAREVLDLPLRIAAGGPIELHVAHAWTLVAEGLIRTRVGALRAEEYLRAQREASAQLLDELLRDAGKRAAIAGVHLPHGDPATAIPALADELDVSVVALGTAGRTGLAGFLIGSAAEAILARLKRSALVVKPPGFVSPVRSGDARRSPSAS